MFSAYNFKKLLPRLIIAAVAIQISWWLSLEAIKITNDVARGIQGLMYAPFGGSDALTLSKIIASNSQVNAGAFAGTSIFALAAAGTAFLTAGASSLIGILALAASAALGILIALFTLVLRQAVIIGLVVTGPLAIAAWVLPGTQKLWKIWWESFSKLLLMYPLIIIIIAGGRIFAYVAANTTGINQFAQFAMIILGCFGPLFLIPATLKVSGAAFGAITGAINNRGKGAFDRLRNVRGNEAKRVRKDFLSGDRYHRDNMAARAVNRVGAGLKAGGKGHFGIGAHGASAIAGVKRDAAARELKENASLQQLALADDDGIAVMALSGGTAEGAEQAAAELEASWIASGVAPAEARLRRERALAAARSVGVTRANAQAGMQLMMQNKARAIAGGEAGQRLLNNGIGRLHPGNDIAATEAAQSAQYFARESGRSDLGGDWSRGVESMDDGFRRTGAYKVVRGHTTALQAHADDLVARHHAALAAGDRDAALETAAQMTAMRNAMGPDVTDANKSILHQMFQDADIDVTSQQSVDEQFGEQLGSLRPVAGPLSPTARGVPDVQEIRNRAGLYDQGDPALRGYNPGGTGPGAGPPSDRRLKKDVLYLYTNQNGIKLYQFRYLWSDQVYVGVMAQDLVNTHPHALSKDGLGYYRVNYEVLGLRMMTIEEWNSLKLSASL